jgi:hypothetical protein
MGGLVGACFQVLFLAQKYVYYDFLDKNGGLECDHISATNLI